MLINPVKTNPMVITTRQKHHLSDLSMILSLDGQHNENVTEHRLLGLIIDNKFRWQAHIEHIIMQKHVKKQTNNNNNNNNKQQQQHQQQQQQHNTHARTHARTHAHTHTYTHNCLFFLNCNISFLFQIFIINIDTRKTSTTLA